MAITVGSLLAGRYEVTAPVAVGGMGEVWQARDQVLDRIVAAKVLRSEFTGDPNFLARFRNEARHTAALSHQNIASVYDYGETVDDATGQKLAFLVMEFVDGQPLVTILHEEGRLPVDWTLHVVGQAADGLSAAHRAGVVHRDIKPGNLMVRPDGMVKLTDFGIAQARDATPLTRTGMVVGTAQYLSPEQAQGFPVTASSDVYSLGVVAYECLTGVRPFDGTSQVAVALAHINRPPPPLPAEVPTEVRALITRALAKDPSQRFPDGGAFAEAIRNVASGLPLDGAGSASTLPGGPRTGGALAGGALAGGAMAGGAFAAATTDAPVVPTGATQVLGDVGNGRTQVLGTGAVPAGGRHAATEPGTGLRRPMPPLQGPPVDDGLPADEYPEEREGSRRWLWLVAALAVLLLLGGGAWLLLSGSGDTPQAGRTTSPPPTSSAPKTVFIDTNAYIGRPATDVADELRGKGLSNVTTQPATSAQLQESGRALAAGDVVTTSPVNQMVPLTGSVTLFVAPRDYAPTAPSAAPTTSQAPRTSAAPQTSAAPRTTVTVVPSAPTLSPTTSSSPASGTVITSTTATQPPQAGTTP